MKVNNEYLDETCRPEKILTVKHLIITILCVAFLIWGLWPGSLEDFTFFLAISSIIWLPILLAICVYTVVKIFWLCRSDKQRAKLMFLRFVVSLAIVFFTLGLVYFEIPLRTAFCLCKSSFEEYLEEDPIESSMFSPINKRLGIWNVDRYEKDPRGGAYFRIGTGHDLVDQLSYGFVFMPNREGTPFGNAKYVLIWITGDWYCFGVSNDY
ncbi:MAG: hypothetical protein ACYS8Z_06455 [Planctomycetota bacterium]|jgi:hypothetical protein